MLQAISMGAVATDGSGNWSLELGAERGGFPAPLRCRCAGAVGHSDLSIPWTLRIDLEDFSAVQDKARGAQMVSCAWEGTVPLPFSGLSLC